MKPIFLFSLLTPVLALPAIAAERTWDGGDVSSNMTAAANWDGNLAITPASDDLNFQPVALIADKTVNNNYPVNTAFRRLDFYDGGYTMTGTIMGLTEGIATWHAAGNVALNASFNLLKFQTFGSQAAGNLTFGGQIFLNGHDLTFRSANSNSRVDVDGLLAGGSPSQIYIGGVGSDNFGAVAFNGAKSFIVPVTIRSGGTLVVDEAGSLGNGVGKTDIRDGTLVLNSLPSLSVPEAITMSNVDPQASRILSQGGAHTLSGPIEFSGDHFKRFEVLGTGLTLSGAISGPVSFGSMRKLGPGRLTLSGAASNTFGIQIFSAYSGEVLLNKSGGATAISSPFVIIGSNGGPDDSAILRLGTSHQIADTTQVNVGSDGWFDLNGRSETIASLQYNGEGRVTTNSGTLRLNGDVSAFSATQTGGTATISGNVTLGAANSEWEVAGGNSAIALQATGPVTSLVPGGILTKTGDGALTMSGNLSVPLVKLTAGITILTGVSPGTDVLIEKASLQAAGTLDDVTCSADGLIRLGDDFANAELVCGNLSLAGSSSFTYSSNAPGGHDLFQVTGTVTLGGQATGSFFVVAPVVIAAGEEIIIIANDGADPIAGQFLNLPEGSLLNSFYILSYKGGDGNDLSVTRIVPPTGVTRVWDGGSAVDNNWMTAVNWNPNGVPQPGDDVSFPVTAARKNNVNNFPAGTTFNSVTVDGTGYAIGGNRILLNQKLDFPFANASNMWSVPLTLALPASVLAAGSSLVQISSEIDTNGKTLTLHHQGGGTGSLLLNNISGPGGVRKTGPGRVTYYEQPSTYSGPTTVVEGTLALKATGTLGSSAAGTIVLAGAALEILNHEGAVISSETITLHGRIADNGGTFASQLNGPLVCAADTATIEVAGDQLSVSGAISGSQFHKTGSGRLTIGGVAVNSLSGAVFVDAGELRLQKALTNAFNCPVIIGNAALPAKLALGAFNQLSNSGTVQLVHPSGIFDLGTFTDEIGGLVMNGGTLAGSSASRLTLSVLNVQANAATAVIAAPMGHPAGDPAELQIADGAANPDLRIESVVFGTSFEKTGTGRVDFITDIPQTGLASLDLKLGSALFLSNCQFTAILLNGGLLGGQGTVGNISTLTNGVISPGSSPGALGGNIGTWNAATTLRLELNGATPGSEYDQYISSGALNLNGTKLEPSTAFDPPPGTEFMIIRNVSGLPISGTFANLPQNGYLSTPGARIFQITYSGGDGNDAVLTRVEKEAPQITGFNLAPGVGPNVGKNMIHLDVKGVPGLFYQLESSPGLGVWTLGPLVMADLMTGLFPFDVLEANTTPRLFHRVRLP